MDEFTIAIKVLADIAEQLVSVYAKQQAKLEDLAKGMKGEREMPDTIVIPMSDFLSHLSFWWFLIGVMLLLMRGMGPPGVKSIDRKKFNEVKAEIETKMNAKREMAFLEKFLLYCGRYFFIYHYYRNDLIFFWFIGGALLIKFISLLVRGM